MYNHELCRYHVTLSYQKLRKMVRQHIDQTIRTRNFKAGNERIETGVTSRVKKGELSARKEKWETAFGGWQLDSVRKVISVVLTTGLILVKEHNHPLLLRRRRRRLTEEFRPPRGVSPSGLKGRKPCQNFLKRKCTDPSCNSRHPPCLNFKSESGCNCGDISDTQR